MPPQDGAPIRDTNLELKPKKGLLTQRVWDSVEYGWRSPLILDAQGRSTCELNPKHEWDKVNNEGSEANARALFSIFNGVCPDEFRRIENCKRTMEAWDKLQVAHEDMSVAKIYKFSYLWLFYKKYQRKPNIIKTSKYWL